MGPRNKEGGNRAKRQGRKHQIQNNNHLTVLRKSVSELELYAVVVKMSGGNLCRVMTQNGDELCCHMGGKFRGRNKRQNFVEVGKWVLVGLREWEKSAGNCDLEYIYDRDEIEQLQALPGVNLKHLINRDNAKDTKELEEEFGFVFSNNVVSTADINNIIMGNVGNTVICSAEDISIDDL